MSRNAVAASVVGTTAILGSIIPLSAHQWSVAFDDVRTVAANGDLELCKKRYGDGYTTSHHENDVRRKRTDTGHEIEIVGTEVFEGKGTITFHNSYEIFFPANRNR